MFLKSFQNFRDHPLFPRTKSLRGRNIKSDVSNEDIIKFIQLSDIQLSFGFRKCPCTSVHSILKTYGLDEIAKNLRNDRKNSNNLGDSSMQSNSVLLKKLNLMSSNPKMNFESDEVSYYRKLIKERVGCDIPNFKL